MFHPTPLNLMMHVQPSYGKINGYKNNMSSLKTRKIPTQFCYYQLVIPLNWIVALPHDQKPCTSSQ
jgi:uncharacterized membrane protein